MQKVDDADLRVDLAANADLLLRQRIGFLYLTDGLLKLGGIVLQVPGGAGKDPFELPKRTPGEHHVGDDGGQDPRYGGLDDFQQMGQKQGGKNRQANDQGDG